MRRSVRRCKARLVTSRDPIAVVGLSCRLPGAVGPDRFWRLLTDGIEAVGPVPQARGSLGERGGFLDHVDQFDADFFGTSPAEASAMDPQQRLALELAWEAFENAHLV